jgi:hypothetical protein
MSQNHLEDTEARRALGADFAIGSPGARPLLAAGVGRTALLRAVSLEGAERVMVGSEMKLDLQGPIDNLRSIIGDLEVYYWERAGRNACQRYQIGLWIRQVSERTALLLDVLMHMGSPTVVVSGVDPAERDVLESAAKALDRWIRDDEPFRDVVSHVATILSAADRIALRAAGGRPEA